MAENRRRKVFLSAVTTPPGDEKQFIITDMLEEMNVPFFHKQRTAYLHLFSEMDNSCCFVVLLTRAYMDAVNDPDSATSLEFTRLLQTFTQNGVAICALEPDMLDRTHWFGQFKFLLPGFQAMDMTTEDNIGANFPALMRFIERFL